MIRTDDKNDIVGSWVISHDALRTPDSVARGLGSGGIG